MSKSITQDMRYRQSLMQYAAKYGVSRASRKYNKSWSYIYFWKTRWNGSVESLACQSRRPHHHPNQHTEAELNLIRNMRRRNPTLGMIELWQRLRKRGYTRCPESLFRVMRKLGIFPQIKVRTPYKPKPYEQMQYPGQRVQVDMKVVPLKCLANPEERLQQLHKVWRWQWRYCLLDILSLKRKLQSVPLSLYIIRDEIFNQPYRALLERYQLGISLV